MTRAIFTSVPRGRFGHFLEKQAKYVLLLPALLLLLALFVYPLFYAVNLSVHDVNIFTIRRGGAPFVGVQKYIDVLSNPSTWRALSRTIYFGGASLILQLVLGMVLALIFNRAFIGKNLLMTICLVPMMITPIAVGMFWRLLLNAQWGFINYLIGLVNIPPQPWLAHATLVQFAVIAVHVWWEVSFVFLIFLGGLSALPVEPFEAAEIDGGSRWQVFRFITLPLMTPIILVVILIRMIDAFRSFDVIYALTEGGPGDASRVIALELYEIAFRRQQYGEAAALGILIMLLMLVLTALLMRVLGAKSGGNS